MVGPVFQTSIHDVHDQRTKTSHTAGIPIDDLIGSNTSVFTGCFSKDYNELQARDPELVKDSLSGNGTALLSNRISYFYDLRGPSMSIDTGCSASLVAMHQACRSIWSGDAETSIVAGTNALLNPDMFIAMTSLG
jgi:acyl transferase domain-containing protein